MLSTSRVAGSFPQILLAAHESHRFLLDRPLAPAALVRVTLEPFVSVGSLLAATFALRGSFEGPDLILALEVFPQALRAAGSSAQEVMERLRDIGMVGWEFLPRLQPVQPPWIYELIRDGDQVDVIVCRNAALLEEVLGRWHGGRLGP